MGTSPFLGAVEKLKIIVEGPHLRLTVKITNRILFPIFPTSSYLRSNRIAFFARLPSNCIGELGNGKYSPDLGWEIGSILMGIIRHTISRLWDRLMILFWDREGAK